MEKTTVASGQEAKVVDKANRQLADKKVDLACNYPLETEMACLRICNSIMVAHSSIKESHSGPTDHKLQTWSDAMASQNVLAEDILVVGHYSLIRIRHFDVISQES